MKDLMNIIVNSGRSSEKGLYHWTCVFKNNNQVISFCSFGSPILAEILEYFNKYNILTSNYHIQNFNEVNCGEYCLLILYLLNNGFVFEDMILDLYYPTES